MLKYILKRLLIFLPTLFLVSLMAFVISVNSPGDPVERLLKSSQKEGGANEQSSTSKKDKQHLRKKLGLDLPVFYFSLGTFSDCDTLYKIVDKAHQNNLSRLTRKYGNWDDVENYYHSLLLAQTSFFKYNVDKIYDNENKDKQYSKNEISESKNQISFAINSLLETNNEDILTAKIEQMKTLTNKYSFFAPSIKDVERVLNAHSKMIDNSSSWKTYIPAIFFYPKNQFSRWIFGEAPWFSSEKTEKNRGVLRGDFGISYIDSQPVTSKIWGKFQVSFIFVILSILISYLVSIPVGIYAAYKRDSLFNSVSSVVLFILYSLPSFFVGTLLLYSFSNPDTLSWFPVGGFQDPSTFNEDWNIFQKISHHMPYIALPLITYTYSSFAFLSRIMRVGMLDVMNQDYIRTARAKGLSEKVTILKHVLRNSLLPIITIFANIFPFAIGGSIIIEVIFSLPGMGLEAYNAVLNYDYPMIVAIFTISGFLTVLGYLVADILYAVADPRISYS